MGHPCCLLLTCCHATWQYSRQPRAWHQWARAGPLWFLHLSPGTGMGIFRIFHRLALPAWQGSKRRRGPRKPWRCCCRRARCRRHGWHSRHGGHHSRHSGRGGGSAAPGAGAGAPAEDAGGGGACRYAPGGTHGGCLFFPSSFLWLPLFPMLGEHGGCITHILINLLGRQCDLWVSLSGSDWEARKAGAFRSCFV